MWIRENRRPTVVENRCTIVIVQASIAFLEKFLDNIALKPDLRTLSILLNGAERSQNDAKHSDPAGCIQDLKR